MAMLLTACATTNSMPIPSAISDQSIAAAVGQKLRDDPLLHEHDIAVEVRQGTVRLTGVVGSAEEKAKAAVLTRQVEGVRKVSNDMEIRATTMKTIDHPPETPE